ncbi:MAG: 4Fe-4S dicluster domain-containing protein [Peptococcaceae bacterium]|nr:4Fe-4S dicluster domain-containing protein [Peptococcaceae bacterium]
MPLFISSSCLSKEESSSLIFDPEAFDPDKIIVVIDADRCIGCKACEVHCWNEHRDVREVGETSIHVMQVEKLSKDMKEAVCYYPNTCAHCEDPKCLDICPAGAITKDENGVVAVYEEKCIGCQTCSTVCPNYFYTFGRNSGRTLKCDGCFHRQEQGLWPACATKCSMKAIYFGYPDEIARILKEKKAGGDNIYIVDNTTEGRETI